MRRQTLLFAAVALLGAAAASVEWTLYLRRFGPVVYGMTVAEAERAAGVRLVQTEEVRYGCTFVQPKGGDGSVAFMVQDGIIVRGGVSSAAYEGPEATWPAERTASGISVGATTEDVLRTYGARMSAEPHPYGGGEGDRYLVYTPRDRRDHDYLMIFETWRDTVRSVRSGFAEDVRAIEGCS